MRSILQTKGAERWKAPETQRRIVSRFGGQCARVGWFLSSGCDLRSRPMVPRSGVDGRVVLSVVTRWPELSSGHSHLTASFAAIARQFLLWSLNPNISAAT